jgi:hypothetical protein
METIDEKLLLSRISGEVNKYLKNEKVKIKGLNQKAISDFLSPLISDILTILELEVASFHANKNKDFFKKEEIDSIALLTKEKIVEGIFESGHFGYYYLSDTNKEILESITNGITESLLKETKKLNIDIEIDFSDTEKLRRGLKNKLREKIIDFSTERSCSEDLRNLLREKSGEILGKAISNIFSSFDMTDVLSEKEIEKLKQKKKQIIKDAILDIYSNEAKLKEMAKQKFERDFITTEEMQNINIETPEAIDFLEQTEDKYSEDKYSEDSYEWRQDDKDIDDKDIDDKIRTIEEKIGFLNFLNTVFFVFLSVIAVLVILNTFANYDNEPSYESEVHHMETQQNKEEQLK